jgi:hypothetical protein
MPNTNDAEPNPILGIFIKFRLIAKTSYVGICQNLSVWSRLRFNFIKLTAIRKLFVPGNVEKFTFVTVHSETLTSSLQWPQILQTQTKKPSEGSFSVSWWAGAESIST